MKRMMLACALVWVGFSSAMMGCSRAAVVCELVCECEHCNDQDKIEACNRLGTTEDVASTYGCDDAWEAYTVCVEERGTCDADTSRFSTENDMGENRCQNEADDLDTCIEKASAHEGTDTRIN